MIAPGTRRWWALGALTLAVLAVGLDGTILSVALPTLATALHASESDLQWFSSGYLLVLAAMMLPAGLLGDRFGRKKVLLFALNAPLVYRIVPRALKVVVPKPPPPESREMRRAPNASR